MVNGFVMNFIPEPETEVIFLVFFIGKG